MNLLMRAHVEETVGLYTCTQPQTHSKDEAVIFMNLNMP